MIDESQDDRGSFGLQNSLQMRDGALHAQGGGRQGIPTTWVNGNILAKGGLIGAAAPRNGKHWLKIAAVKMVEETEQMPFCAAAAKMGNEAQNFCFLGRTDSILRLVVSKGRAYFGEDISSLANRHPAKQSNLDAEIWE